MQFHPAALNHVRPAPSAWRWSDDETDDLDDVVQALAGSPKSIPSKYLYDAEGSRLFSAITRTLDYYVTRAELEILREQGGRIAAAFAGSPVEVVELGAGDGTKTLRLLGHLRALGCDVRYVAVDVSPAALEQLLARCARRLPEVTTAGIVADYEEGLRQLGRGGERRRLALFLGSTIGNLEKPAAVTLLSAMRRSLAPGDQALIGFDLKKDPRVLQRAYDDARGLTRAFNLNLLTRLNRELDADFDLAAFDYHTLYDPLSGGMRSYLVSLADQVVSLRRPGVTLRFRAFEPIHTETSLKYRHDEIEELAVEAGFEVAGHFQDAKGRFCDCLWQAPFDA